MLVLVVVFFVLSGDLRPLTHSTDSCELIETHPEIQFGFIFLSVNYSDLKQEKVSKHRKTPEETAEIHVTIL